MAGHLHQDAGGGEEDQRICVANPTGGRAGEIEDARGRGTDGRMARRPTDWRFRLSYHTPPGWKHPGRATHAGRHCRCRGPREKGVWKDVQMVGEVLEALEGELQLDERGNVEGLARATWPDGATYVGQFRGGLRHGHGTVKWANGDVYVGDYENGEMHGRGTYSHANGDVVLSLHDANQHKGPGIWLEKASGRYFLLKDGQVARELSRAEAGQSAFKDLFGALFCLRQAEQIIKEHGLPELPS